MRIINRTNNLRGRLRVPGDKSISHRAVMFGALAEGVTEIHGFLKGADCLATIDCFRAMGIEICEKDKVIYVHGKGLHGLSAPTKILDVGNSGTTTRLISGILAGQAFPSVLSGDASLNTMPRPRNSRNVCCMRHGCSSRLVSSSARTAAATCASASAPKRRRSAKHCNAFSTCKPDRQSPSI